MRSLLNRWGRQRELGATVVRLTILLSTLAVAALAFGPSSQGTASGGVTLPWDLDGDGCSNFEEMGLERNLGGLRDPSNPWDFYDVAGRTAARTPDGKVDMADASAVSFRWGSELGTLLYDPFFDRANSAGPTGPDGDINILAVQAVYGQFGDSCQDEPLVDLAEIANDCGGEIKTAQQLEAESEDTTKMVMAVTAKFPDPDLEEAQKLKKELAILAAIEPALVQAGEQHQVCVEVVDEQGKLIGVSRITTQIAPDGGGSGVSTPDEGSAAGGIFQAGICGVTKVWDSDPFGTDIAKMTHIKEWAYVDDPSNNFDGFISFNPPAFKINEIPSYFGFRFATVGDDPETTWFWYWAPFYVVSVAETQFLQLAIQTRLKSHLLVGFDDCYTW